MLQIESWFVIAMGLGTVFVGLISIILLCKILGAICSVDQQKNLTSSGLATPVQSTTTSQTTAPASSNSANRQEIIAAIGVAIAEEEGVGVDAIRIVSIKRI